MYILKAADVPLFITGSALKADAGLSIGLLTLGILGIDGWRAKNTYEGVTTHPAWEEINLSRDIFYVPDTDAEMPLIKEFLLEIMDSSSELISFIRRMLGYCLTGDTREQILPVCFGVGANGKTTLLGLFQEMLGDYATATSTSLLMVKRNESIPCDLAALKGARFVTASEVEDGQSFPVCLHRRLKAVLSGNSTG